MTFTNELEFEKAFVKVLTQKGWSEQILMNPTEKDLIQNWANILFANNNTIDRLNSYPLTDGEMSQIIEQITTLKTPLKLNGFINGKTVSIKRDNPDDTVHFGKEISLKIYDRSEIAAGQSCYQIVRQPQFARQSKILPDRRGDVMLLINGMPVIHIELKKTGIPVSQATNQIEKYAHEGIFTGLFSLIQIFVAMNPEEAVYFANPGLDGTFNKDYFFHWADFNNEPINNWKDFTSQLLSIPMAHQLIGFYTVADDSDGVLKVMRSYQFEAAARISDAVFKHNKNGWQSKEHLGGFVWHTTGSGKTMTSFKSAQLIAHSGDADKVIFLMDRIELATQSLKEYKGFASENETVQATENTHTLISKLKSTNFQDTLILTSIQKMSNIQYEENGLNANDIEVISQKRIVIIVDEAHRSTFGDMVLTIKKTFPKALFFGFTGTPIHTKNQKNKSTTTDVFGNEIHRYSIADGIRDKNVLGFDPYKVLTYKDKDLRTQIALQEAKAGTVEEVFADEVKTKIYNEYMDSSQVSMIKIEELLPRSQYKSETHKRIVVKDIQDNWISLSQNNKFHAILATSSIKEAIEYYRLFKEIAPSLLVTSLFDPHDDNSDGVTEKLDGLVEIITDYNKQYEQDFTISTHALLKKDMSTRLAHKDAYKYIDKTPEKRIDILIVVDQMLTGFDSKWVNTLYLDKMLKDANLIQAFSRTNRLFGKDKPHGIIRYYKNPHTMEQNILEAIKLYSGDIPLGVFVQKLDKNLDQMNDIFKDIKAVFAQANIDNFESLPEATEEVGQFVKLFNQFNEFLGAAKVQGFDWNQSIYEFKDEEGNIENTIEVDFTADDFLTLLQRYKEAKKPGEGGNPDPDVPFDIDGYITEIDTGKIDTDYMNRMFTKYLKSLTQEDVTEAEKEKYLNELHKSFAVLSQEEQKIANFLLHGIQSGDIMLENNKTLRDYITEYQHNEKEDVITNICISLGVDESKLRDMLSRNLTEQTLDDFGRFTQLKATVDKQKAKAYFEGIQNKELSLLEVNKCKVKFLKEFILEGKLPVETKKEFMYPSIDSTTTELYAAEDGDR